MNTMENDFLNEAKNPAAPLISDVLKRLGVWVWRDYIATRDILDMSNEPSLSGHDLSRMDQDTHEWFNENLDNSIGSIKQTELPKTFKLYSSQLYPVENKLVLLVESILNTFDAFVIDDEVYIASFFKEKLQDCYTETCCDMFDWEDQWIED